MKLRYRPGLLEEVGRIIKEKNVEYPGRGDRLRATLDETLERLILIPHIGSRTGYKDTRRVPMSRSPYVLIYTFLEHEDVVYVIAFTHSARHESTWTKEVDSLDA